MLRRLSILFCTRSNTHIKERGLFICWWDCTGVWSNYTHISSIYLVPFRNGRQSTYRMFWIDISKGLFYKKNYQNSIFNIFVTHQTLNLPKSAIYDGLNGKVINLIANDMVRFELALSFFHDVWKGPIEAILIGYFIYQQIGIASIIGMAFLLSFIPIQSRFKN